MPPLALDLAPTVSPDIVLRKIARRLIPFMSLCYILAYLDRVNLGYAKLGMLKDLNLDERQYGLGAGMFFIGYFLFEVPSNLILHRTGARAWIARIMITWGIIATAMALVRGPRSFYGLRFILGVAEAGFFPGMVLYLSFWFPQARRARMTSLFFTSAAVSSAFGAAISGAVQSLNGRCQLAGWQWLFIIEGVPSILVGVLVYLLLTDSPQKARWLTDSEKRSLAAQLEPVAGSTKHHASFLHALADLRLWLLAGIYFMLMIGLYGIGFWMPTVIKAATHASDRRVSWMSAIPYLVAIGAMLLIGMHSDKMRSRYGHVACCALLAAAGFAIAPLCHSMPGIIFAFTLAAIGIFSAIGPFWAIPGEFLKGAAAAGGIAAINSIGNLGGYVGPFAAGYLAKHSGHYTLGLLFFAALVACGAILVLILPATAGEPQ